MKIVTTLVMLATALTLAGSSLAGPPLAGSYSSSDLGGPLSTGRYTEGWTPGGGALAAGTTMNCMSWNGTALGTEWRYTCGSTLGPATLLIDNVDVNGNGNRTYMCPFYGGQLWLSGSGPWANGDASYPGVFDSYIEYETIQYVNHVAIAAVTNVQAMAHFNAYPNSCMGFSIANGSRVGTTSNGDTYPANYPALLATDCSPTMNEGAWWTMTSVTISITSGCTTPARPSTWGGLKTLYR